MGLIVEGARPPVDERELAAARELRHAIHATFAAIAQSESAEPEALDLLRRTFAEAVRAGSLRLDAGRSIFEWPPEDPRRIRFAIAVDAIDLLRWRADRVRICSGPNCGWLFHDTSGRRRWCSMDACGSRAKMRRLYERRRAQRPLGA
jgi:predicted RNA-binding Zn ribbon-like protein